MWVSKDDKEAVRLYRLAADQGDALALFALVPLPIAWLLAYALVRLVRWIRAGFKPSA
jgi:TPR repeat protein